MEKEEKEKNSGENLLKNNLTDFNKDDNMNLSEDQYMKEQMKLMAYYKR